MPFPLLIPAISAIGSILGGAAKGASEGRKDQAAYQMNQNNAASSQYNTQQGATTTAAKSAEQAALDRALLDLKRRQFGLDAAGTRMSNAARGSQLANVQDVKVTHPRAHIPEITGGIRPSNLTPEARQLGALIARQSLMDQMKGDNFSDVPMQDWKSTILQPPGVKDYPKAGTFEKIGSIAGMIGSGLGGIQQAIGQYSQGGGGGSQIYNPNAANQPPVQAPWNAPQLSPASQELMQILMQQPPTPR